MARLATDMNLVSLEQMLPPHLIEAVYIAVGEASVCWEKPGGAGIFDSSKASRVAADLCWKIAEAISNRNNPSAGA